jgi:hypothetical protein
VVINNPATEAASCSATRTTLVGSTILAATISLYSPELRVKAEIRVAPVGQILAATISLYSPELRVKAEIRVAPVGQLADHNRTLDPGILCDLPYRRLDGLADDLDADLLVAVGGAPSTWRAMPRLRLLAGLSSRVG